MKPSGQAEVVAPLSEASQLTSSRQRDKSDVSERRGDEEQRNQRVEKNKKGESIEAPLFD